MTKEQQSEINKMNDMLKKLQDGNAAICNRCGKGTMQALTSRSYVCPVCGTKLRLGETIVCMEENENNGKR